MRFFPAKRSNHENKSRKKIVPVKRNVRWLKPVAQTMMAALGITGLVFGALHMNDELAVKHWKIQANTQLKPQIEKYLASRQQLDFWHTRASVMQEMLLAEIPDIKTLEVRRILPNDLLVKAEARKPMALWESMAGQPKVMIIDETALAYRALKRGENLDLPILRLNQEHIVQATGLLHALHKQDASKLLSLSEVVVAEQQWRMNFAYGEQWQMNQDNIEQDMKLVMQLLAKPQWARGHWRMDARIPQRWFIRPAKQEVI